MAKSLSVKILKGQKINLILIICWAEFILLLITVDSAVLPAYDIKYLLLLNIFIYIKYCRTFTIIILEIIFERQTLSFPSQELINMRIHTYAGSFIGHFVIIANIR